MKTNDSGLKYRRLTKRDIVRPTDRTFATQCKSADQSEEDFTKWISNCGCICQHFNCIVNKPNTDPVFTVVRNYPPETHLLTP